jgi:hypothetical protein
MLSMLQVYKCCGYGVVDFALVSFRNTALLLRASKYKASPQITDKVSTSIYIMKVSLRVMHSVNEMPCQESSSLNETALWVPRGALLPPSSTRASTLVCIASILPSRLTIDTYKAQQPIGPPSILTPFPTSPRCSSTARAFRTTTATRCASATGARSKSSRR